MNGYRSVLYSLVLALWVGGIAVFTFIVTPAIFKSFPRDAAGEIVGKLFPAYFSFNLVMVIVSLVLFLVLASDRPGKAYRLSVVLLFAALLINVYIKFKLHPQAVAAKQQIASFESVSPESPERKKFARLHGFSAALNLVLLADGVILMAINPLVKK